MDPERRPLRFAVMLTGETLARWQAIAFGRLVESGHGQPVALISDVTPRREENNRESLLWRLIRALDAPAALRRVEIPESLAKLPRIEYSGDRSVAEIQAQALDLILFFGDGDLSGPILDAAAHGVWVFRHGDQRRGGPPYFWEVCDRAPVSGATLERMTEPHAASVVYREGFLKTLDYSYSRNCGRMLLESANWPAYAASAIRRGASPVGEERPKSPLKRARGPSVWAVLRFAAVTAGNIVRRLIARCFREEWNIGVVPHSIAEISRGASIADVKWFAKPADGWVADPMVLTRTDGVHVLCELMDLRTQRGYIAATRFDGSRWSAAKPVLPTPCHAAYPFLFEEQGQVLCIPETADAEEVGLYRAVDFPDVWEKVTTLLRRVPAVDSTIFKYRDIWWLFATIQESSDETLCAWYAPALTGPWEPHAANPLKVDVRSARPAGPLFWRDGEIIRPAQDCSKTYGGRIVLNRIEELTPTRFREQAIGYVEPDPRSAYGKALHTLSPAGNWCVIDGKRWRLKGFRSASRAQLNHAPELRARPRQDRNAKPVEAALR